MIAMGYQQQMQAMHDLQADVTKAQQLLSTTRPFGEPLPHETNSEMLDRVVEKLREEFVHQGRPEHFERLKVFLLGQSDAPYAALAREMNTSEGALKVAIHRLRKRYREIFRQEIADTVADPAEVESELRFLAAVLSKK